MSHLSDLLPDGEVLVLEEFTKPSAGRGNRVVAYLNGDDELTIAEEFLEKIRRGEPQWCQEYDGPTHVHLSPYALARLVEFFAQLPQRYPTGKP